MEINENSKIKIISGEGICGTDEVYTGKMTERAIKSRLMRERCGGDRWARAEVYLHDSETGPVGIDFETGVMRPW